MSFPLEFYNNEWEYWQLYHKVTFDGENKLIIINPGETEIDVQIDIYSAWKEWVKLRDNMKFEQALGTTGGDPLPGSLYVGRYFFLQNGWKVVPPEDYASISEIDIIGNLFSADETDIMDTDPRPGVVLLRQTVSSLTQIDNPTVNVTGSGLTDEEAATLVGTYTASVGATSSLGIVLESQSLQQTDLDYITEIGISNSSSLAQISVSGSLTSEQSTMLLEMYRLLGLDPTKPLVVTPQARTVAPEISQSILQTGDTVTVTRS